MATKFNERRVPADQSGIIDEGQHNSSTTEREYNNSSQLHQETGRGNLSMEKSSRANASKLTVNSGGGSDSQRFFGEAKGYYDLNKMAGR
jgi:hypothetical protein